MFPFDVMVYLRQWLFVPFDTVRSSELSNNLKNNSSERIRRPQEGNAAWKATRNAILPGYANRRRCICVARHSGLRCGQLAMKGVAVCRWHGGNMVQTALELAKAKRNAKEKPLYSIGHTTAARIKRTATSLTT
jgi:hypothetical protein